jgi:hypothetical protein
MLLAIGLAATTFSMQGCKARECPAFSEGQRTGGSIDKNKKRRSRVKQGVFEPKVRRRYR